MNELDIPQKQMKDGAVVLVVDDEPKLPARQIEADENKTTGIDREGKRREPILGETLLGNGSIIPSIERVFVLAPAKEDPRVLSFGDGKTFYTRDAHGALRRLTPKGKK